MAQDAEHDAPDLRDPVINPAIGNGQAEDGFPTGGGGQRSKCKQGKKAPQQRPARSKFQPLVRFVKQVSLSLTLFFCLVVVMLAGLLFYFSDRVDDDKKRIYQ